MKKVILAPRVSSDEQAKGTSLKTQEQEMRAYCEREGYEVVAVYREDHSAKNFNRPEFRKLLEYLKANKGKIDLLLVTTWCRFSRNITESFAMMDRLKKLNVEVQAIEQPLDLTVPENLLMQAVYLAIPEIDNRRRSIKITTGVRASKREGRWLGRAPFGYESILGKDNKMTIIPGPQSKIVKDAFQLISKGKSQSEVRVLLKKAGKSFSRSTLSDLLRNRVYAGEIRVKTDEEPGFYWVKGIHEPLVTNEAFKRVQMILEKRLSDKSFIKAKSIRSEFPLRGSILCAGCGSNMTGSLSKGRNGRHAYYHCNHCRKVRVPTEHVHTKIESILQEIRFKKSADELLNAMISKLQKDEKDENRRPKEKLQQEIDLLNNRIRNIENDYADRKLSAESFARSLKRYESEVKALREELSESENKTSDLNGYLTKAVTVSFSVSDLYQNSNPLEKKQILGSIFPEKLQIDKENCRTTKVNEGLQLILAVDKGYSNKKTGQLFKNLSVSGNVVNAGVEPKSHFLK